MDSCFSSFQAKQLFHLFLSITPQLDQTKYIETGMVIGIRVPSLELAEVSEIDEGLLSVTATTKLSSVFYSSYRFSTCTV